MSLWHYVAQAIERLLALAGLIVAMPVIGALALVVAIEDGRPVFFRQLRVGRNGRRFWLIKLRSMRRSTGGSQITAGNDGRITRIGRVLRKYKLDELPQLWNVVKGDMNLIGPRPEVPDYVDMNDPAWAAVLKVRPGISDLATLVYRNEEELLGSVPDPDQYYRSMVLPDKLALNIDYIRRRTPWSDLRLLGMTLRYSLFPAGFQAESVRQAFSK